MNGLMKSTCLLLARRSHCESWCDHWPRVRLMSCEAQKTPVRVRFAPSPTGLLHLGGFRTALLNYLFATKHGGSFILRIEDTDQTRLVPKALENMETDLCWLGLKPTEGPSNPGKYGPYLQSHRLSLYEESLSQLIESGHAYECFCTEKRLDLLRREALRVRQKPRYDNKCRDLTREEVKRKKAAGAQYCVRFKFPPEQIGYDDLVFGRVDFDLNESNSEGDPVIMKSDGFPTYHFANVVDDHLMEISHVLRGVEWQVSTPKHLQLFKAFKWDPPLYGHLPLVLNKDGTKLSKRQGDISIAHYRNETYYASALTNFVIKSGGGFPHSFHEVEKLHSQDELVENFELTGVNASGCRLDFIVLERLNQLALKDQIYSDSEGVIKTLEKVLESESFDPSAFSRNYLEKIVNWSSNRVSNVKELASSEFAYLWSQPNPKLLSQIKLSPEIIHHFMTACTKELSGDFSNAAEISGFLEKFSTDNNLKQKIFLKDLRTMLCGVSKGPPIVEIFQLFGKEATLHRLNNSVQQMEVDSHSSRSAAGT